MHGLYSYSFLHVHEGWRGSKIFSSIISNSRIRNNQVLHGISSTCNCRQPSMHDVETSPAFILTQGVSFLLFLCSVSCFNALNHTLPVQVVPGLRLDSWMCIFACLEEIEQYESHQRVPEMRSGDKIFWLLGFNSRQSGDCFRQPEKFQLLCSNHIAYLIHT